MKKQAIFFILWDVLFFVLLYVLSNAETFIQRSVARSMEYRFSFAMVPTILPMVAGGFIGWLVFVTWKFKRVRKIAVLEFVLVGGFALYLCSIFFLYYMPVFVDSGLPRLIPMWILYNPKAPMTLGGVLFGYELCVFIIRMIQCGKKEKPATDIE